MQTNISALYRQTSEGKKAEQILRSCVHCGFCTATCPTYQLLGDELDSPRGRIYLIKQMLEGHPVTQKTQLHLDRCLTCRACETTCPSGVEYLHLLEIGRHFVNQKVDRSPSYKIKKILLTKILPYPKRFSLLLKMGRISKPLLPQTIQRTIPDKNPDDQWANGKHSRKMIILNGCVQPSLSPQINAATSRVLNKLGIELINHSLVQCCGAVNQHLDDTVVAREMIKKNIDAWYPMIHSGEVEAIVMTASGCGAMVKEYEYLLADDGQYAEKAKIVSRACKDISEIISHENIEKLNISSNQVIAFHAPCSLQHGQKLNGVVENILSKVGFKLNIISDSHLCCGSAGTYSILQPKIAQQLKHNKLKSLAQGQPELIATANIGCLHHLASGTEIPIVHWIELLDNGGQAT